MGAVSGKDSLSGLPRPSAPEI